MSHVRVAAIVVHYRGEADTRACLRSLLAARPPVEVVFVDNSGRGAGAFVRDEFPGLEVHDAGPNRGWAAGCNVGTRVALASGVDHVLFVNTDVVVEPGFLAPMLEAISLPRVGAVTGKLLLPAKPGWPRRIWSAGGRIERLRSVGVNEGEGALDGPSFDAPRDVSFATGCLLLVRREVFEAVGLLDERMYLYMEDVDFSERVTRAGYRIRYEPRAVAVHKVHGAIGGVPDEPGPITVYYLTRNRFIYARERLHGPTRVAALSHLLLTRAVKASVDLLRGRPARAKLIVRATYDGLRGAMGAATIPLEGGWS